MSTAEQVFCTNHPQTPTLLRCNRCNRPMCLRCLERTPVGYRCKECLGLSRAGYYNATGLDHVLAGAIGFVLALIGGALATIFGGFWLIAIFVGPAAGGLIAEAIRFSVQRRRGRYLRWVAGTCAVLGAVVGPGLLAIISLIGRSKTFDGSTLFALPFAGLLSIFNLGFLIFIGLAVSTLFYRLRA